MKDAKYCIVAIKTTCGFKINNFSSFYSRAGKPSQYFIDVVPTEILTKFHLDIFS